MSIRISIILILSFFFPFTGMFGQGSQVEFGKNRVQYHDEFETWLTYESRNFITYWYAGGRDVAESAILIAEKDYKYIENLLEHRINDKIEIIVYKDITDLKQSNIGTEEVFENTGGVTKIVDNKVFIYFDGNHHNLRRQIREGIASVYLNTMLFGSNLQEIVQNAVMMNLPNWFKAGLVGFVGEPWNTELDNQLRDVLLSEDYQNFDSFAEENPKLAGHSMWNYVYQNYGNATVSSLLYLTRINRSVESGFLYVLGSTDQGIIKSWEQYYTDRYTKEVKDKVEIDSLKGEMPVKNRRKLPMTQVKISPDGKRIAYVLNDIGRYKVYIQDVASGKRNVIYKSGFRNQFQSTDYNYPLLAWKPNNQELAIMYEKRDIVKLMVINTESGKEELMDMPDQYHRVYSMDFLTDNRLVMSAAVRGNSDIFIFRLSSRQTERITRDFYDDLDVAVVEISNRKGIVFASNRRSNILANEKLDTVLPANNFDLYFYDLGEKKKELIRLTNTPLANERQPVALDSAYFGFTSDQSGIYNLYRGFIKEEFIYNERIINLTDGTDIIIHEDSVLNNLDSLDIDTTFLRPVYKWKGYSFPNSNYSRNVQLQNSAPRVGLQAKAIQHNGKSRVFIEKIGTPQKISPPNSFYQEQRISLNALIEENIDSSAIEIINPGILKEKEKEAIDVKDIPQEKQDTGKIDIDNYLFQSEFDDLEEISEIHFVEETDKDSELTLQRLEEQILRPIVPVAKVEKFRPSRITPYRVKFRTDFFNTQLDNSLLFGGLDSYSADRQEYTYQTPGILLKTNFKDLFEDHEIEAGARIPTTFNGSEYFLVYENKRRRLDKTFAVYRRARRFNEESQNGLTDPRRREITLLGQYGVKYPFDIFRSLRLTSTLRMDQIVQLSTDRATLETPTVTSQRAGLRLEYVFDNTLDVSLNIKNGTRYKFYVEALKSFALDLGVNARASLNEGFTGIAGFDARHYQKLAKHSVLAFRAAGAASFGSERILFFMGGVDRWLFPSQNTENLTPIPEEEYAFQTLAASMRGFRTNIRNGSSFVLGNAEMRVPIFHYFSKRLKSNFLRNFQLIGFYDIGTAWEGLSPYSDDNPLNTRTIESPNNGNPSVIIDVNYFRDPVVMGYGAGIRTMLFGYFLRVDYAWGIETRIVQDPILYLSIGTDF